MTTTTISEEFKPFDAFPPNVFCKLTFLERILRSRAVTLDSKASMNYWPMSMVMKDAYAEFDVTLNNDDYIRGTYDHQGVLNAWLYGSDRITVKDNILDATDFTDLFRWLDIPEETIFNLTALHLNYEWLTDELNNLNKEATELVKTLGYPDWQYFVDNYESSELYQALSPDQYKHITSHFVNYMVHKLLDPGMLFGQDEIQTILLDCSAQITEVINNRLEN